jgi:hypothetical protein
LNLYVPTGDKRNIIYEISFADAFKKLLAAYGIQEE